MKYLMKYLLNILLLLLAAQVYSAETQAQAPIVNMQTTLGTIVIELNAEKAPNTVANFLRYVKEGFYNDTIFHRVIKGFMVQGGGFTMVQGAGFTKDFQQKKPHEPIRNEANNGLKNVRGTIAMARTSAPHSATAQFFINVVNNSFLDYKKSPRMGWGYAVFGKVIKGMNVIDKIEKVKTGRGGSFRRDVPHPLIIIKKVTVAE
jgi:peptidyl-prolyl cis-trans isomerase B (cyclophilin B)